MLIPDKDALKARFEKTRQTSEYKQDYDRLASLEFADFMKEFLEFHSRVTEEMVDELGTESPTVEEREWFYLYYGGELYSDVIKAKQWGHMVDMALELIDKEQQ